MYLPPLLANLFVVGTFHWNLANVNLLRLTLTEVGTYAQFTNVDAVVIANDVSATQHAISTFDLDLDIHVWDFNGSSPHNWGGSHDMLWEHRSVIEEAFKNEKYTTFLYMEDDTHFPWPQLVSWAIDTEVLVPLGFTRGIFRTEINEAGKPSMNDMVVNLMQELGCTMNLTEDASSPNYVKSIDVSTLSPTFNATAATLQGQSCLPASNAFDWFSQLPATPCWHRRKEAPPPRRSPQTCRV